MSRSGWVADGVLERVGVGHQVAVGAVGVDQLDDARTLVDLALVGELAVDQPAHRLVRDPQRREDLVVELVGEQQLVDPAQELAGLGPLDDAVVVRRGQRHDLADRPLGEHSWLMPLNSAGYSMAPTPTIVP